MKIFYKKKNTIQNTNSNEFLCFLELNSELKENAIIIDQIPILIMSAGVLEFSIEILGITSNMARTKRVYHLSTSTRRSEFLKIFSIITENS